MLLAKIVIFILIQVTYLEQQPQPPLPLTDTLPLWCFLCNAVLLLAQLGESYACTVCTGSLQTWHYSHTHFQQQPQPVQALCKRGITHTLTSNSSPSLLCLSLIPCPSSGNAAPAAGAARGILRLHSPYRLSANTASLVCRLCQSSSRDTQASTSSS